MIIVDTHVHTSPYWFEPIDILLWQMNMNRVDKAAVFQYDNQFNNRYLIELARHFPGRLSAIAEVDTERADASEILRQWVKEGVEGLRLTATTRSPGKDPLAIWRTCAELDLPVTCLGKGSEFVSDEFRKLVQAVPEAPIIIEHLGSTPRDEQPPYPIYRKILALSDYPNIYIKVGGLGEFCERSFPFRQPFPFENVQPFIQMAYRAFGPSRMMWGSNYPPSSRHEGYGNTLRYLDEYLTSFCPENDKEWIFGKTALSLFKFQEVDKKIP